MAIVKQLDHITVFCNSADDQRHLFGFLTGVLGFPAVNSTTVWLGNVAIRLLRFAGSRKPAFKGLSFEPYSFPEARRTMNEQKFPFYQPFEDAIFITPEPHFVLDLMRYFVRKSDFYFHNMRRHSLMMMLSERTPRIALWKSKLGMAEVDKVVVSTTTPNTFAQFMNRLTQSHEVLLPNEWKLGDSPTIVMQSTGIAGITAIHCRVHSLPKVRAFLDEHGILDEEHPDHLVCAPLGLRFCFNE